MSRLLNASSNLRGSVEGPESTRDIVKRIEMRQSHAISNLKLQKTLFNNYKQQRKAWSNMRAASIKQTQTLFNE